MTAEEIRKAAQVIMVSLENKPAPIEISTAIHQMQFVAEIAAQLAELNAELAYMGDQWITHVRNR